MIGQSWTHRMARIVVAPLADTAVTPNHLTTLRLLTGLVACAAFALGTRSGDLWGGAVWLLSAFLDRADGELARITGKTSRWGHTYDYYADESVNALFFVAIGIGMHNRGVGNWALVLGLWTGALLLVCGYLTEQLEQRSPAGTKAYAGRWGFDFDDTLYLLAPLAWLGWLQPVLFGAGIVVPFMAVLTGIRLRRRIRLNRSSPSDPTAVPGPSH